MVQQNHLDFVKAQIVHHHNDVSSRITFTVEDSSSRKNCRKEILIAEDVCEDILETAISRWVRESGSGLKAIVGQVGGV